jgi:hypothetical protein
MQTPKTFSTQITVNNTNFTHNHPISPYKAKIKTLQTSVFSSLNDLKFKTFIYKWTSKYLLLSSFLSSSMILTFLFFTFPSNNYPSSFNLNKSFKYVSIYNFSSSLLYNLFQPSYNYLLYKEVQDGLNFLYQNIDQYIDKVNEDDYTNYTLFKNSYFKLLKKLS